MNILERVVNSLGEPAKHDLWLRPNGESFEFLAWLGNKWVPIGSVSGVVEFDVAKLSGGGIPDVFNGIPFDESAKLAKMANSNWRDIVFTNNAKGVTSHCAVTTKIDLENPNGVLLGYGDGSFTLFNTEKEFEALDRMQNWYHENANGLFAPYDSGDCVNISSITKYIPDDYGGYVCEMLYASEGEPVVMVDEGKHIYRFVAEFYKNGNRGVYNKVTGWTLTDITIDEYNSMSDATARYVVASAEDANAFIGHFFFEKNLG